MLLFDKLEYPINKPDCHIQEKDDLFGKEILEIIKALESLLVDNESVSSKKTKPKFSPGKVIIIAAVKKVVSKKEVSAAIRCHINGDCPEMNKEDAESNDLVVQNVGQVISSYKSENGITFCIKTEFDRSSTLVFLSD